MDKNEISFFVSAKTKPMADTNIKIIEELKAFLTIINSNSDLKVVFTEHPTDFTRKRKLTFERTILLILNMLKKSLSIEINDFFELVDDNVHCTKSAFSIQRKKLNASFFEHWNKLLVACFYHYYEEKVKKWKGFLLIAVDGSTSNLVKKEEVMSYFGVQVNQHVKIPMARIIKFYGVLHHLHWIIAIRQSRKIYY